MDNVHDSQICPSDHLPSTAICLMQPVCFWHSAAQFLLKQSVLTSHLSYTATNFWSLGNPPETDFPILLPNIAQRRSI
jgi:hypothetical protein